MKQKITVDYELLREQRREFESLLWNYPSTLLDGLLELIERIEEERPFKEEKNI